MSDSTTDQTSLQVISPNSNVGSYYVTNSWRIDSTTLTTVGVDAKYSFPNIGS